MTPDGSQSASVVRMGEAAVVPSLKWRASPIRTAWGWAGPAPLLAILFGIGVYAFATSPKTLSERAGAFLPMVLGIQVVAGQAFWPKRYTITADGLDSDDWRPYGPLRWSDVRRVEFSHRALRFEVARDAWGGAKPLLVLPSDPTARDRVLALVRTHVREGALA